MALSSSYPPWVRENPDEQGLVNKSKYSEILKRNMPELLTTVRMAGLWIYLITLGVIDESVKADLQSQPTNTDQVIGLIDYLFTSPCWKLHGFMRALCLSDQAHILSQVLHLDPQQYEGDQEDQDQLKQDKTASSSSYPPWVRENPDEQRLVYKSKYSEILKRNMPELLRTVRMAGLWIYLITLGVIDESVKADLQSRTTDMGQVDQLIAYLLISPCWKLHGFLRALCLSDQAHILSDILELNPQDYIEAHEDQDHAIHHKQPEKEQENDFQHPQDEQQGEDVDALEQSTTDVLPNTLLTQHPQDEQQGEDVDALEQSTTDVLPNTLLTQHPRDEQQGEDVDALELSFQTTVNTTLHPPDCLFETPYITCLGEEYLDSVDPEHEPFPMISPYDEPTDFSSGPLTAESELLQADQPPSCPTDEAPVPTVPQHTFSGRYCAAGGVLHSTNSDVVLTIPPGALPEGETFNFCVNIYTNLMDYNRWFDLDTEYIIGPVVECKVSRNVEFQKPVVLSVPLCTSSPSDVKVLHSMGDTFEDTSMRYGIMGDFIYIKTEHFTKFLIKGKKPVYVDDVFISIAARMMKATYENIIELRLMSHTNCLGLKDFIAERKKNYPPTFNEIDIRRMGLPNRETPFPEVVINMKVRDGYEWLTKHQGEMQKQATRTRNGRDVIIVDHTEALHNFTLESKEKSEQVSVDMGIIFRYTIKKTIEDFPEDFIVTYPGGSGSTTESQPDGSFTNAAAAVAVADAAANACDPLTGTQLPLWDSRHPDGKILLIKQPDLEKKLTAALPDLKETVIPDDLWSYLLLYGVMEQTHINRCKSSKVEGEQVERLVLFLKKEPVWKTHAFFRALAKTDQGAKIYRFLGPGAEEAYTMNFLDR